MKPETPFYIEPLGCWVHVDTEFEHPGEVRYDDWGVPHIVLKEYDERVLLHECIHVVFFREAEARAQLGEHEERFVRFLTRALYATGWRLRKTDREIAKVEHELNETANQRDELARELDGRGAPAREFTYQAAP